MTDLLINVTEENSKTNEVKNLHNKINILQDTLTRIANEYGHCKTCKVPCEGFTTCDCSYSCWEPDDPVLLAKNALETVSKIGI